METMTTIGSKLDHLTSTIKALPVGTGGVASQANLDEIGAKIDVAQAAADALTTPASVAAASAAAPAPGTPGGGLSR